MSRVVYPSAGETLSLRVEGVFGTPEDWKTTDDANPGLFTYTVRCFRFQIEKGKIVPKELTARELREQEDKNKKGGKKQSKKEQGNAEQDKIKKQQQQLQRKREEEWATKNQEDRKHRDFQDPFRAPQLRFQNNSKTEKITGKALVILQERVRKDQGQWLYFIKSANASEDDLAKMRKAKPKTLNNINDLNPIIMRAWVDFSKLNSQISISQRCKLVQVDKTPDTPEPNLQNAYIKINLSLEQPLVKKDDGVVGEKLIADPPPAQVVSQQVKVVQQLRDQLRLGIESLAMQFSAMFWKQLNIYQDFKNLNMFISKKNDIIKRKEHFLYDFNVSGKYKILKDRIKKVIVHLCQKYFTQQMGNSKSFTGVSCTIKDQFYSQIYTFLVSKYKQALQELIFEKKQKLGQVEVLSKDAQTKKVERFLESRFKQRPADTINRVIEEYVVLGDYKYGENLYQKTIEANPTNVEIKYAYAIYCIKNKLKKAEEALPYIQEYLSYNKDNLKVRLEYLLLLIASEAQENCKKAWVFLRELIIQNPRDITYLLIANLIFSDFLGSTEIAQKFLFSAQRLRLKELGTVPEDGQHKQNPIISELSNSKGLPSFGQSLSPEERDKSWIEVLNIFLNLNLLNVVEKVKGKIKQTNNTIFEVLNLKHHLSEGHFQQFQVKAKQIFERSRSEQVLQLIVNYYILRPNSETEQYLKTYLIKTKGDKQLFALLKLSSFYLNSKQFANAKACILKYLEKKGHNSGYSWRILGISELNLGHLEQSLDSLKKANVLDITNSENWLWLTRVYSLNGNFVMANQCVNQYQAIIGKKDNLVFLQALEELKRRKSTNLCEQKLRLQLVERLQIKQVS